VSVRKSHKRIFGFSPKLFSHTEESHPTRQKETSNKRREKGPKITSVILSTVQTVHTTIDIDIHVAVFAQQMKKNPRKKNLEFVKKNPSVVPRKSSRLRIITGYSLPCFVCPTI
jgi:hypothetical protein